MITETQLKDQFESISGFKDLVVDHGTYAETYRSGNVLYEPINGSFQPSRWVLTAISGLTMATTTATIAIFGNTLDEARAISDSLNTTAERINGNTFEMNDAQGSKYAITMIAGLSEIEEAIEGTTYHRGEIYPVVLTVSYTIIESGVSSTTSRIKIDGDEYPVTQIVTTLKGAAEMTPTYAGESEATNGTCFFEIDAVIPLLQNEAGKKLYKECVDTKRKDIMHMVELVQNGDSTYHMMIISNAQMTSIPPSNIGVNISLLTGCAESAVFGGGWTSLTAYGKTCKITLPVSAVVFWGDGTATKAIAQNSGDVSQYLSHVYTDSENVHNLNIYGADLAGAYREIREGDDLLGKTIIYIGEDWDVSGEADSTEIVCRNATLSVSSGYLRELYNEGSLTISDSISNGQQWVSGLDVVTGIKSTGKWAVYIAEAGV